MEVIGVIIGGFVKICYIVSWLVGRGFVVIWVVGGGFIISWLVRKYGVVGSLFVRVFYRIRGLVGS